MLFVAAAGNGNFNNDLSPSYPASYPNDNIIAVAGTDNRDAKYTGSQWGLTSVDIAGPAVNVLSSVRNGTYQFFTGTSMATPHVTGAAALLFSVNPGLSYQEVRDAIFESGDPNFAFRTDGPNPIATGKRLNVFGALQAIGGTGIAVLSTSPAGGSLVVGTAPTDFVVNFSRDYLPGTIAASDFAVNGIPASSFTLLDDNSITFHYAASPAVQGLNTMAVAAGALTDLDGNPVAAFSDQFRFDAVLLQVVATNPPPSGVLPLPAPFSLDVHFNEPLDPGTVQSADLVLGGLPGALVTGASVLAGDQTIRFTIGGVTVEGTLNVSIAAGALTDAFGNPGAAFAATYQTDGVVPYPVPLTAKPPLGSLIYDPVANGVINFPGDTDQFSLNVDLPARPSACSSIRRTPRPLRCTAVSATAPAPRQGNCCSSTSPMDHRPSSAIRSPPAD
jgi:subtilisin family serine protease